MQEEIWKDIPGYEGLYQASNLGEVKSLDRMIGAKDNRKLRFVEGKILKFGMHRKGYYQIHLKSKCFKVHKIIATTFLGHIPCGMKEVVDHINNNKLDNRVENLQLTTNRHNSSKDKKNNSSRFLGACLSTNKKRFVSYIHIDGIQKYLGTFNCEFAASVAYHKAVKQLNALQKQA